MAWNRVAFLKLRDAYDTGNPAEFVRVARLFPDGLRDERGRALWLHRAAEDGKIGFLEALIDLGQDVNESHPGDPMNPFWDPEGCIIEAVRAGQLEAVRWLLDHGATINHTKFGSPSCGSLLSAASRGHLEIAKLLVERGADIHGIWYSPTPKSFPAHAATMAEDCGQFEVRDFLRSLGARTVRETTPPDYPTAHEAFLRDMSRRHQHQLDDWQHMISSEPPVVLRRVFDRPAADELRCRGQIVFTLGMSDRRLPERYPEGVRDYACSEVCCFLPADWPLTPEALRDPLWNWPVLWLERVVGELRRVDHWPDSPATFMNGDPPQPLAPNTRLSGWHMMKLDEATYAPDHRWLSLHVLYPIYPEEASGVLSIQEGSRFSQVQFANGIAPYINPHRPVITNFDG